MTTLISKKTAQAIYKQISLEYFASLQYEAISAWFRLEGLPQLAAHYAGQAAEELAHAHRFMKYVVDAGAPLELLGIDAPKSKFKSAVDAAQVALDHELIVTESINKLLDLAEKEGDRFTQNSLQWFIQEQLEEVSSADELLQMVKRAGEGGLLIVEHYLANRGAPTARS